MNSFNTKLVLSAIGIALLATPAFAQRTHRHTAPQTEVHQPVGTYPNPVTRSGSADSVQSGQQFDVNGGY